jgi:hypothetical protein
VKKKAARRETAKKSPQLSAKPLRELWSRLSDPADRSMLTTMVSSPLQVVPGVPLPPDLEEACRFFAQEETRDLVRWLLDPPLIPLDNVLEDYEPAFDRLDLDDAHVWEIQASVKKAVRIGFNLALLRYADDLKHVPEAAALLEKKRSAAKKGGNARRKQAEPNHKAIRKRFRELRKTVPKKTARYVRVAGEFEMSDRQIARIVDGID